MSRGPAPIEIGMRADVLRTLPGRTKLFLVAPPQWLENGEAAIWHYRDCSVILRRPEKYAPYLVDEVVKEQADG